MSISSDAIGKTVDLYYDDIYRFCCVRLRDPDAAQDVAQETFKIFVDKAAGLEELNLRSWLYRTAFHRCAKYLEKRGVEGRYVSLDNVVVPVAPEEPQPDMDGDELFDAVQKKILSLLTEKERKLFVAFYLQRRDAKDIAEAMDISEDNVRVRATRIKQKIKK